MTKILLLCATTAILMGSAMSGSAQTTVTYGPRLGGQLANATYNALEEATGIGTAYSYSKSPILAPQVGMALNVQRNNWAFQPALLFSQKGVEQKLSLTNDIYGIPVQEDITVTSRINYLELPLNVVYRFGSDKGFILFGGPYAAIGVGGRAKVKDKLTIPDPIDPQSYSESGSVAFHFGNSFPEDFGSGGSGSSGASFAQVRRFDAGLNAGVGYYYGPYQLQLGYSLGLLNIQPDYPDSYQVRNTTGYHRVVQLAATYYIPRK